MELRKDLVLVAVEYENDGKKAILTYLDEERKQVRTVNFNKQAYKDGKYVDDPGKAGKVDEWCSEYFKVAFPDLGTCVGQKNDIYCYERFNSLWEVEMIEKFTKDMKGQIFQSEVKEIVVDDYFIKIRYPIDGKIYESKMSFGIFMKDKGTWYQDPIKKDTQYRKFEEKYHVPVEEADKLIGHPLMVEVKSAFGTNYYGDIKAFPKGK